ncbi:MAG TPA: TonB-dependent receptor, partial [Chitinophagaceae bacterium]|nr:TonB-dependent receptor [Chitinophagaceae bacterium]
MLRLFCFLTGLVIGFSSNSQTGGMIVLKVTDQQAVPISNATIELMRQKDSALLKAQITDGSGAASFNNLLPGNYFFRVSRIGFITQVTGVVPLSAEASVSLSPITLQPSINQLSDITVSARKPFIELKPGKTIVNMESSSSSVGATALEALEKLPGITIDKDGAISLKGRSGVMILLDGKPSYLDAAQLSALLSGMSASQISQVEIMNQPSARYDAAGNAGVINIKTKKNGQKGFN